MRRFLLDKLAQSRMVRGMDPKAFVAMAALEERHWWFTSRRAVLRAVLQSLGLPPRVRILEAGCGSGGNFSVLAPFGPVTGVEPDESAAATAQARGLATVKVGGLPGPLPLKKDEQFDVLVMTDVLEHLADPIASLQALRPHLAPGARLVVTVPAHPWLFGAHDAIHHHFRRYSAAQLRHHLAHGGFRVQFLSPINCLLFPVAVVVRFVNAWLGKGDSPGLEAPSAWVNALCGAAFGVERFIIPLLPLPFGLSYLAIAVVKE